MHSPIMLLSYKANEAISDFSVISRFLELPDNEQVERGEIMRCTEICDVDGDYIYSGHIVEFAPPYKNMDSIICIVEYFHSAASFILRCDDNSILYLDDGYSSRLVKIRGLRTKKQENEVLED